MILLPNAIMLRYNKMSKKEALVVKISAQIIFSMHVKVRREAAGHEKIYEGIPWGSVE